MRRLGARDERLALGGEVEPARDRGGEPFGGRPERAEIGVEPRGRIAADRARADRLQRGAHFEALVGEPGDAGLERGLILRGDERAGQAGEFGALARQDQRLAHRGNAVLRDAPEAVVDAGVGHQRHAARHQGQARRRREGAEQPPPDAEAKAGLPPRPGVGAADPFRLNS